MNYWQLIPIGAVVLFSVVKRFFTGGLTLEMTGQWILLMAGWFLGWVLGELDHLVYATICNPQELSCQRVRKEIWQRNWKNAWGIMQDTKGERDRLPVRNILTAMVVGVLGVWLISSNGSFLAAGTVFGLEVRLLSELLAEKDYKKWYWVFAREFSEKENQAAKAIITVFIFIQFILLINK
jgi:hypothetical protein